MCEIFLQGRYFLAQHLHLQKLTKMNPSTSCSASSFGFLIQCFRFLVYSYRLGICQLFGLMIAFLLISSMATDTRYQIFGIDLIPRMSGFLHHRIEL